MDKDRLPRWGWLLVGLFGATIVAQLANLLVFFRLGLPIEYGVVAVIAAMSPVLIFVGLWYDEEKADYWENRRERIVGDVLFILLGASLGASVVLVGLDGWPNRLIADVLAMAGGFTLAWGLFYWRNPDIYFQEG